MLLLPFRFAYDWDGFQFLLLQRGVNGGQLCRKLILELLDHVFQFATQDFSAINLRRGGRPVVAVHVAVNRGQEFAEPFLTRDRAAFFGSHNLRADLVHRSGQLGETLAQGIVGRQLAGPLGCGIANSDNRIDRPAHAVQHFVELHGQIKLRLALCHRVLGTGIFDDL